MWVVGSPAHAGIGPVYDFDDDEGLLVPPHTRGIDPKSSPLIA